MSRKSAFFGMGTFLLLAVAVGGVLVLLVRHEPGFYQRCAVPAGEERRKGADQFQSAVRGTGREPSP